MLLKATELLKARRGSLAALAAYLLLSAAFYYRPHAAGDIFNPGSDQGSFIWFLNWWPYAITHGINPFVSHFVWAPHGSNLMWSTSVPTLALLCWPVTLVWGAETSWNLLSLAAPALDAFGCYILLRTLSRDRLPSLVGGGFFGFSTYVTAQLLGHINLSFVALVPLLAAVSVLRLRGRIGTGAYIAVFSLLLVLQFGISDEVLATSALVGLIAFATFYARYRRDYDFLGLALASVVSGLIAAIILSPAFYFLVKGLDELPAYLNSPTRYSADLLNFFVPTSVIRLGRSVFVDISHRFTGNDSENGTYLGLPVFFIAVLCLRENMRKKWFWPFVIAAAATAILSLGPRLWVNGVNTGLTLPWQAVLPLPLIRHALPVRLTMYLSLFVAVMIAVWLDVPEQTRGWRLARYVPVLLAALFLLPNPRYFHWGAIPTPPPFTRNDADRLFGHRPNLVVLPYGPLGASMLWQIRSGMSFTMAGGYVGMNPPFFDQFPAVGYFKGAPIPADDKVFLDYVSVFCRRSHVDGIVVMPGTRPALVAALGRLPWAKTPMRGYTVIGVPKLSSP